MLGGGPAHRGLTLTVAALASCVVLSCGRPENPGVGAKRRPSIVLVLVDALRPDHLGCYGYRRLTSPVLDSFAASAVVFENAVAVSSWTKPSIPSLFTSLYPSQHGVFEGSAHGDAPESDVLPDEAVTLAETLKERGYATAAFVNNLHLRPQFGLAQGFDRYEELSEPAPVMVQHLLAWLQIVSSPEARPFFAYLHLLDAHWPYTASAAAARAIGVDWQRIGLDGADRSLREAVNQRLVTLSAEKLDALIARYDAAIRSVDDALGELQAGLADAGTLDEMVVLVTADHGEEFLEHGLLGHGDDLYEESLHVPLILRLPHREAAGRRIAVRVSSLDVMPTILELAGPSAGSAPSVEGRSLMRYLRGNAPPAGSATIAEVKHKSTSRQAIWKDGWKLIRTLHRHADGPSEIRLELYDLGSDGGERSNRAEAEPATTRALLAELEAWEGGITARSLRRADRLRVDDEAAAKLRALGYVR